MRPRLPKDVAARIEHLSRVRGVSFQQGALIALDAGLRAVGELPASPVTEPCDDAVVTLPVPASVSRAIKKLAAENFQSNRGMMRHILLTGLRTFGAWPPADAVQTVTANSVATEADRASAP